MAYSQTTSQKRHKSAKINFKLWCRRNFVYIFTAVVFILGMLLGAMLTYIACSKAYESPDIVIEETTKGGESNDIDNQNARIESTAGR